MITDLVLVTLKYNKLKNVSQQKELYHYIKTPKSQSDAIFTDVEYSDATLTYNSNIRSDMPVPCRIKSIHIICKYLMRSKITQPRHSTSNVVCQGPHISCKWSIWTDQTKLTCILPQNTRKLFTILGSDRYGKKHRIKRFHWLQYAKISILRYTVNY